MSEQLYEAVEHHHGRRGYYVLNGSGYHDDEVIIFPDIIDVINDYNIECKHVKNTTVPLSLFVSDGSGYHGVYICLECVVEAYDQLIKDGKIKPSNKINSIKEI